jgi:hypothetical protein
MSTVRHKIHKTLNYLIFTIISFIPLLNVKNSQIAIFTDRAIVDRSQPPAKKASIYRGVLSVVNLQRWGAR